MRPLSRSAASLISILLALSPAAAEDFSACPQFFANAKPPVVAPRPGKQRAAGLAWIALVKSEMKHIQPIEARIMRVKRAAERPVEESKQFWYAEYLPEEKCSTSDTEDIEAEDY